MSKESTSKELSQAIKAEIVKLSRWDKENELLHYITIQIRVGKIKPEHFLCYAIQNPNIKNQVKPFGITANIINRIGVVVSELPDPQQNKLWLKFYMLAADRDDDLDCVNYASLVIDDDIETALKYAKKAVDLTQKLREGKDKYKWVLGSCLLKCENFGGAFTMFAEYFSYQIKRYYWSGSLATKQEVVSEFKPKIITLIDVLRNFVLQAQNFPAGENWLRYFLEIVIVSCG